MKKVGTSIYIDSEDIEFAITKSDKRGNLSKGIRYILMRYRELLELSPALTDNQQDIILEATQNFHWKIVPLKILPQELANRIISVSPSNKSLYEIIKNMNPAGILALLHEM